jgi:hypothetical protein
MIFFTSFRLISNQFWKGKNESFRFISVIGFLKVNITFLFVIVTLPKRGVLLFSGSIVIYDFTTP